MKRSTTAVYTLYIIVVTLLFDFALARVFWKDLTIKSNLAALDVRCEDTYFHHALKKKVEAIEEWGNVRYPLITNSLGFKDYDARDIQRTTDKQRIIFIGDSFTE